MSVTHFPTYPSIKGGRGAGGMGGIYTWFLDKTKFLESKIDIQMEKAKEDDNETS